MNLYTSSLAYFFLVLPEFVYFCFIFFFDGGGEKCSHPFQRIFSHPYRVAGLREMTPLGTKREEGDED
tara:strand:- start:215 stop:418 length:204 start_codon:yes stop_codon:yes gene_type:complete